MTNISGNLKPIPGTYALILQALKAQTVEIGRLGSLQVVPGYYVYIGSAFGPGGLRARIGRHLGNTKVRHWHIDYMMQAAFIQAVWFSYDPVRHECDWAKAFQTMPGASVPLKGFGSSECKCFSHLYYFAAGISKEVAFEHMDHSSRCLIINLRLRSSRLLSSLNS